MTLELEPTADILAEIARRKTTQIVVGFAAETENVLENARKKLASKSLDAIVVNDVSRHGIGFDSDRNAVTIISSGRSGRGSRDLEMGSCPPRPGPGREVAQASWHGRTLGNKPARTSSSSSHPCTSHICYPYPQCPASLIRNFAAPLRRASATTTTWEFTIFTGGLRRRRRIQWTNRQSRFPITYSSQEKK